VRADATTLPGRDRGPGADHARAGAGWALVTDGCSSVPLADVGARLISSAVAAQLAGGGPPDLPAAAATAAAAARLLGLPPACLAATALVAWIDGDHACAELWGDGELWFGAPGAPAARVAVVADGEAPAYPALDPGPWLAAGGRARRVGDDPACAQITGPDGAGPLRARWPLGAAGWLLLASDGLRQVGGHSPAAAAAALTAWGPGGGAFVSRRARRWARALQADGHALGDDLGLAALRWGAP